MKQNGFSSVALVLTFLVISVLAIGGGTYYHWSQYQSSKENAPLVQTTPTITPGENDVCTAIQGDRTQCYTDLIQNNSDPLVCDAMQIKLVHDGCYLSLEQRTGDISLCGKLLDDDTKGGCYLQAALAKKDSAVCAQIKDSGSIRDQCMARFSDLSQPNPSLDPQRMKDIGTIQSLLELYYGENNHYPQTNGEVAIGGKCLSKNGFEDAVNDCSGTSYGEQLPANPKPWNAGNCPDKDYTYTSNRNSDYVLGFCLASNAFEKGGTGAGQHTVSSDGNIK